MNAKTQSAAVSAKLAEAGTSAVIAIYETHQEAEQAIRALERSGVDMQKLSIVGKDYYTEEEVVGFYTTGDRMKAWGKTGAFWGGLWGLLFGSAFFMIPGLGPLLAAGPIVAWIVGALEGAVVVGGLGAVGAALYSVGISEKDAIEYEAQIKAGKFVVVAHGTPAEVSGTDAVFSSIKNRGVKKIRLLSGLTVITQAD